MEIGLIFRTIGALLLIALAGGWLARRLRQPTILGELAAGALLGVICHGHAPFWEHQQELLHVIGHLGLCALLFAVGLEVRLRDIVRVGRQAALAAAIGVVTPFLLGWWISGLFGLPSLVGLFIAASLAATSVGITAEVLDELGIIRTDASRIILSAAVLDDVLGLIVLTFVSGVALNDGMSPASLVRLLAFIVIFFGVTLLLLRPMSVRVFAFIQSGYGEKGVMMASFCTLLFLAYLAELIGLDAIVGAFLAGLTLAETREQETINLAFRPFVALFAALFFLLVGTSMDVTLLNPFSPGSRTILALSSVLLVAAILGKLACGLAVSGERTKAAIVGIGMIPRGEVGLICGNMGVSCGVLANDHFSALLMVVMVTTFLGPVLLRLVVTREMRLYPLMPPEDD